MTNSIFTDAAADILHAVGETATFTPSGGDPVSCYVNVEFNVELQPGGGDAEVYAQGTTVEALLSEILIEPNRGDVFTVGDDTYTVQAPLENDGIFVKVQVI
jgi:hypothetical protein